LPNPAILQNASDLLKNNVITEGIPKAGEFAIAHPQVVVLQKEETAYNMPLPLCA
jgi:hypothetical protein